MSDSSTKKYIAVLRKSNSDAMRLAQSYARDLGMTVLNRQPNAALTMLATPDQAEAAQDSGLFSIISSQAISVEAVHQRGPDYFQAVRVWNAQNAPEYRDSKKDRSDRGKSWADPDKDPFPPQTAYDPGDFRDALLKYLQVEEAELLDRYEWREGRRLTGEEFSAYESRLAEVHNATIAYQISRLVWHLAEPYSEIVLEVATDFFDDFLGEADCWRMHGEISVGVVFVESASTDGPVFSSGERSKLEAEIVAGLDLLAADAPDGANLTWVYDWQHVTIDVPDGDDQSSEIYWRDPAIGKINFFGQTYAAEWSSIAKYREDIRLRNRSAHAFVIFVTPYGTDWHAYAGGGRVTLANRNNWGKWGIKEIDRITAHEACHLFGAADEYTGDGTPCVSCASLHGCFKIPNGNCGKCARPKQKCLMAGNHRRICAYTQAQIGWADLFVELTTADTNNAGTDDIVWLDIGDRQFQLSTPNHDDRERNHVEGYALNYTGVTPEEVKRVGIRKSPDGSYGGWRLQSVRVWARDQLICDEDGINQWLEDEYLWWASDSCGSSTTIVNKLQVRVTTSDVKNAGTDDTVRIYTGNDVWVLDNKGHDDFERGNTDVFDLDPGTGLYESDLLTVMIYKNPDGSYGGWRLRGLELLVNGSTIYDNQAIDRWLKDDDRVWLDVI